MSAAAKRFDMNQCVLTQVRAHGLEQVYDANEVATFSKELEWLQAGAVEAKFPELKGLSLVPVVGGGIFPGARTHAYREVSGFGEAEILDTMAPEDFGTAEVTGSETTGVFRSIGAKYIVSIEELRAKPSMTIDIEAQKGALVRKVIEQKLDRIVLGTKTGLNGPFKGLIHDDNSIDDTSSDDWETGTEAGDVAAILATFRRVRNAQFLATAGLFPDLDFVLSTKQFMKMGLFVPSTTVGGGTTVGNFLLQYVPGIRSISHCSRLDNAVSTNVDRLLAFPRDPEVLDFLIPTRFEQWAPQLTGMAFTTYCAAKVGGLRIKHSKAIRRADVTMS